MRLKEGFALRCDEDDLCIVERLPDGTEREAAPLSSTAAMAIDGMCRNLSREAIIDAVTGEFQGADRDTVAADLDGLMRQLIALGFAEE